MGLYLAITTTYLSLSLTLFFYTTYKNNKEVEKINDNNLKYRKEINRKLDLIIKK